MENRGRHRGRSNNHRRGKQGTRPQNRKPSQGKWVKTPPAWEKDFCAWVGSLPWREVVEAKKYTYLYSSVLDWDASACEEALENAKIRFWHEINGLLCDVSLPDPNIYIDKIDWDAEVDPELILDLDRCLKKCCVGEEEEGMVELPLGLNEMPLCTGWGDEEEKIPNHGDWNAENYENYNNSWEQNYDAKGWTNDVSWDESKWEKKDEDGFNYLAGPNMLSEPPRCTGWSGADEMIPADKWSEGYNEDVFHLEWNHEGGQGKRGMKDASWGESKWESKDMSVGEYPFMLSEPVVCTGWGDAESVVPGCDDWNAVCNESYDFWEQNWGLTKDVSLRRSKWGSRDWRNRFTGYGGWTKDEEGRRRWKKREGEEGYKRRQRMSKVQESGQRGGCWRRSHGGRSSNNPYMAIGFG